MAWIRACGGGLAKKKEFYLLKTTTYDDVFEVQPYEWDRTDFTTPVLTPQKLYGTTNDGSGGQRKLQFTTPIDLTKYSKLYVRYKNANTVYSTEMAILVGTTKGSSNTGNFKTQYNASDTVIGFDISNISGNQYFTITSKMANQNIYSIWLEEADQKFLYKDGVQSVEWDNSGYKGASDTTNDGGLNLLETNIGMNFPTTNLHDRCIITQNPIDLSQYSYLKVLCNGTKVITVNISSIQSSAYIAIRCGRWSNSNTLQVITCSQKNLYGDYSYTKSNDTTYVTNNQINRVWLEK